MRYFEEPAGELRSRVHELPFHWAAYVSRHEHRTLAIGDPNNHRFVGAWIARPRGIRRRPQNLDAGGAANHDVAGRDLPNADATTSQALCQLFVRWSRHDLSVPELTYMEVFGEGTETGQVVAVRIGEHQHVNASQTAPP